MGKYQRGIARVLAICGVVSLLGAAEYATVNMPAESAGYGLFMLVAITAAILFQWWLFKDAIRVENIPPVPAPPIELASQEPRPSWSR
jgi:hypothetical protein